MEKIYTLEEVGARYDVSPFTVRNWIYDGRLRAFRIGKTWKVPESALVEYEQSRVNKAWRAKNE